MPAESSTTPMQRFGAAGFGAAVAEVLTLPVDAAKVRLQLQVSTPTNRLASTEAAKPKYTGLMQGVWRIGREEGLPALWRGLEPALVRQVAYTGMSFVLYEPVRNLIAGDVPNESIPFYKRVLAGGTAGGISIMLMNPTDVIKTQMQAHKGSPAMSNIATNIWSGAGLSGFWRGWQPNVARCFIGNACEIGCYDEAKTRLVAAGVPDGPLSHFAASGVAGIISAIFSTPVSRSSSNHPSSRAPRLHGSGAQPTRANVLFAVQVDVVKTRLMAQAGGVETAGVVQYTGVVDCFMRMPRLEGVSSLYKGFVPIAARKVLWTVIYFLTYEQALKAIRGKYS